MVRVVKSEPVPGALLAGSPQAGDERRVNPFMHEDKVCLEHRRGAVGRGAQFKVVGAPQLGASRPASAQRFRRLQEFSGSNAWTVWPRCTSSRRTPQIN